MKTQTIVLIMVVFVWLIPVVPTQLKGEWNTAVMECGGLSVAQGLIQEMVKWCVDNLDTRIHVSLIFKIMHVDLIINSGVKLFSSNKFGRGTGPLVFVFLSCTGNEQSIINCPHSYFSYHYSDIGIRCLLKGYMFTLISIAHAGLVQLSKIFIEKRSLSGINNCHSLCICDNL